MRAHLLWGAGDGAFGGVFVDVDAGAAVGLRRRGVSRQQQQQLRSTARTWICLITEPPLPMTAALLSARSITTLPPSLFTAAVRFLATFFGTSSHAASTGMSSSSSAFFPFLPFFFLPFTCGGGAAGSGAGGSSSSSLLTSQRAFGPSFCLGAFFGRTGFEAFAFFFCRPPMRGACSSFSPLSASCAAVSLVLA